MSTKPTSYTKNIVVTLDEELKQWILDQAQKEERPVGQMARVLLREAREARVKAAASATESKQEPAESKGRQL